MVKKLIDISEDVYWKAKSKAADKRLTISEYVEKAIKEKNGN